MAQKKTVKLFVVAVDGSAQSDLALDAALELAAAQGAQVRVVSVEDIGLLRAEAVASAGLRTLGMDFEEVAASAIARARKACAKSKVDVEYAVLPVGDPAASIVKDAEARRASLIVVGSHGRTGISRVLMGSVAERVMRMAHCPVLVVR
jgi:nucleotide-binding universal stress UspA family protein